ncbi:MAG TPA: zinc-dependent alcohol dehydrogenase family protein [Microbacterium sp.]|uniref:zinc-dependent alcohol dehydrogenase family protein n=1 Tax=Microbacterium sp. TaxID=51671 RepID=UPI002B4826F5|nr:zinc-dependent alcohol dehydrogenase family protein [Microbacterium sp.]HKT56704.1 zinc-dependent alcohol dehydrogenase family protein [Microbacterium sp.]
MRATVMYRAGDVRLEEVPDPQLQTGHDAIVRVVAACVCGSDLWGYRGVIPTSSPRRMGHEFVGIVENAGADVENVRVGDFVIGSFYDCDFTCEICRSGFSSSCLELGWYEGCQAELIRVPHADGSLAVVPADRLTDELVPHLLTLSDVFGTGHHAAHAARVGAGSEVAVVGDGAVGLSAVLAAHRLGASRIVAMSRNPERQALAREFGATDIVEERGAEGAAVVKELFRGIGPQAVLEAVGTAESMEQAVRSVRPGGTIGYVGVPHGGPELPLRPMFSNNTVLAGGIAPVRNYIDELLPDVLSGAVQPGRVFDLELPLSDIAEAYRAMDERRAIKVLVRP